MEYSLSFSNRLIESADHLFSVHYSEEEAGRAILYLSCLSCEISLKALLEGIGLSVEALKGYNHNLLELLNKVSSLSYIENGRPCSDIRSIEVISNTANGTVGTILSAELTGASVYPNKIRYGEVVRHYPPEAVLNCAKVVNKWCVNNSGKVQTKEWLTQK